MDDRWRHERETASKGNLGIVRSPDLRLMGLTLGERREAVSGLLHVRRGSYFQDSGDSYGDSNNAQHLVRLAAVLLDRPDAVASHASAALLHDFPVPQKALDRVNVSLVAGASRRGFRHEVHTHSRRVSESEVVLLNGLAATSAARTVIDCARSLDLPAALVIADDALHRKLTTTGSLTRCLGDMRRTHGIATARRVVALADAGSESPGETRTRLIVVEAGFEVETQVVLTNTDGVFLARGDMRVKGTSVILEFDGRAKFSLGEDVEAAHWAAKLRRDRIEDEGFHVLTVVWADLARPRLLVQRLERMLIRAGYDPAALRNRHSI